MTDGDVTSFLAARQGSLGGGGGGGYIIKGSGDYADSM
jgi:hypothetical protein